MIYRLWFSIGLAATLAAGVRAEAQGAPARPAELKVEIPRSLRPPPGMSRVWVDNVPGGQQPAPTDCASAIRKPSSKKATLTQTLSSMPLFFFEECLFL